MLGVSNARCKSTLQCYFFFFFNDTATTEIYTLSLHDALPILFESTLVAITGGVESPFSLLFILSITAASALLSRRGDRKSTRLNSSHGYISYAVFCLKKNYNKPYTQLTSHPYLSATDPIRCRY